MRFRFRPYVLQRLFVAVIIVAVINTAYSYVHGIHSDAADAKRKAAEAKADAKLAQAIAAVDHHNTIGLERESAARIISECKVLNEESVQAVADEFRNLVIIANALSPIAHRTRAQQLVINADIAVAVGVVKQAHPLRNCSPSALGIPPISSSSSHTTTPTSRRQARTATTVTVLSVSPTTISCRGKSHHCLPPKQNADTHKQQP